MENVKFWDSGNGRWVWNGCRHPGGFASREAAEIAYVLYGEYYAKNTTRSRRKLIEAKFDELAWGKR